MSSPLPADVGVSPMRPSIGAATATTVCAAEGRWRAGVNRQAQPSAPAQRQAASEAAAVKRAASAMSADQRKVKRAARAKAAYHARLDQLTARVAAARHAATPSPIEPATSTTAKPAGSSPRNARASGPMPDVLPVPPGQREAHSADSARTDAPEQLRSSSYRALPPITEHAAASRHAAASEAFYTELEALEQDDDDVVFTECGFCYGACWLDCDCECDGDCGGDYDVTEAYSGPCECDFRGQRRRANQKIAATAQAIVCGCGSSSCPFAALDTTKSGTLYFCGARNNDILYALRSNNFGLPDQKEVASDLDPFDDNFPHGYGPADPSFWESEEAVAAQSRALVFLGWQRVEEGFASSTPPPFLSSGSMPDSMGPYGNPDTLYRYGDVYGIDPHTALPIATAPAPVGPRTWLYDDAYSVPSHIMRCHGMVVTAHTRAGLDRYGHRCRITCEHHNAAAMPLKQGAFFCALHGGVERSQRIAQQEAQGLDGSELIDDPESLTYVGNV